VRWLRFNLAVNVIYGLVALLVIRDTAALDGALPSDTPLRSDLVGGVTAVVLIVSTLVTGIVVLKWIYRADANIQRRAPDVTVTPLWAVLFYFVPVLSLWKPFTAMREIWQASHALENWRKVPVPSLLRWWWGLFLASAFLGQASMRAALRGTIEGIRIGAYIDAASLAVYVPLTLAIIAIIRQVTAAQAVGPRAADEFVTP
jgi:hypothetical protein